MESPLWQGSSKKYPQLNRPHGQARSRKGVKKMEMDGSSGAGSSNAGHEEDEEKATSEFLPGFSTFEEYSKVSQPCL